MVLPGEEEEDVCLKKGSFASWCMVASIIWSFIVNVMLFGYFFKNLLKIKFQKINFKICKIASGSL